MKIHTTLSLLLGLTVAAASSLANASIEGTYVGSFLTGNEGGAAYSYVHSSTTAKKNGDANYNQYAGGGVIFAIDNRDQVSFSVTDTGMDGFGAGDIVNLDLTVNLLAFDGSLDNVNDTSGGVVGTLSVSGALTVGGNHSASFTDGISNITAADTAASFAGLNYSIEVTSDFTVGSTSYSAGDVFDGDAFFQSGALAGPFNGVSYDAANKEISFAVWGDSRNMDGRDGGTGLGNPNNTGTYTPDGGSSSSKALGFDLYITASVVPEAASVLVWGMLASVAAIGFRRNAAQ